MEKLHVTVGYVFTQVMFCDGRGKMHFHRVMTDVDKPWKSVKEVLGLVRSALGVLLLMAVQVEFQYKQVHFSSLLAALREELMNYLDKSCQLTIQVFDESVEEPANVEEEICEEVHMDETETIVVQEMGQAKPRTENRLFPIYREADAAFITMESELDRIEAWNRKASQSLHFFVDETSPEAVAEFDQRGSPVDALAQTGFHPLNETIHL